MKTAELKREITKATGLKNRSMSIKQNYSSVDVAVKELVPLSPIAEVVDQLEHIHRCDYSGEILSGGNTFTFTEYMHWDRNKDEAFDFPVPPAAEQAILAGIAVYGQITGTVIYTHICTMIARSCAEQEKGFFKGWSEKDIESAISFLTAFGPQSFKTKYEAVKAAVFPDC